MNRYFDDHQPSLPPLLDEFRIALLDEIEVAKRKASNNATPLSNGHRVGEQGNAHQYAFLIDSILNTPDGAPGDLIVPGKAPLGVTIVSVEGLRIVISVETDLGKFVPIARLQTNLSILMRKLIERIENNSTKQNPAANRMMGKVPVSGNPVSLNENLKLNQSQLNSLQSALGRDLTVIWGPPGTGKTYTIGTITEYLHKASRTVLLVSHTNTAVDQAIKHVAKSMKDQIHEGVVIRVGEVKDEVLRSDYPDVLLRTQVERQSGELVIEREKLTGQRQKLADEMSIVQKSISIITWLNSAPQDIEFVEDSITEINNFRHRKQEAVTELAELRKQHSNLIELHKSAANVLSLRKKLNLTLQEQTNTITEFKNMSTDHEQLNDEMANQESRIEIAKRIDPLRIERNSYPSQIEQKSTVSQLSDKVEETKGCLEKTQIELTQAKVVLNETKNSGILNRIFKRLPKAEDQQIVVNNLSKKVTTYKTELVATQQAYNVSINKLARIIEIDYELSRHESIGTYHNEVEQKTQSEHKLAQVTLKLNRLSVSCSNFKSQV